MRKIITLLLILLATLSLFGCSQDYLQNYKDAVEKTQSRESGKERILINIENEFNDENISQEIKEELNYLKNIQLEINSSFNENENENKLYIKYRGLGYDLTVYAGEKNILIYIPMIGKYLQLEEENFKIDKSKEEELKEIENLFSRIQNEWLELLKKENVVKGKRDIMTTKDGDIKVDKYTVEPSEEQLRLFLNKVFGVLRSEENTLNKLLQNQNNNININEIIEAIEKAVGKFEKITFENEVFIDIDGYIVKEYIDVNLEDYDPKPGANSLISINIEIENWENEVEQIIKIPEISEEDIIDIDSIDDDFQNFLE